MPPPTTQTPSQLAEINSLNARLSVVKTSRVSLLLSLDRLKTQHAHEYAKFLNFGYQINQKKQEADYFAHFNHLLREYSLKLDEMNDIGQQRARAFREWEDLGVQISLASREIGGLEQEISELERNLSTLRAGGH